MTIETMVFRDDGAVPNSVLPLVIRRAAFSTEGTDPAATIERIFTQNGWTGTWQDGIFDYHHYHSTAHEVLAIAAGSVIVRFGGQQGRDVRLSAGDVVVVPAGMGHRRVRPDEGLLVVGAYADGRVADIMRAEPGNIAAARGRIAAVPLPRTCPIDGAGGALVGLWRDAAA